MPAQPTASSSSTAWQRCSTTHRSKELSIECGLRLPLPDTASASVLLKVLKSDPSLTGTSKEVYWWSEDPSQRTVAVTIQAASKRDLRSAIGSLLEQAKLIVRTLRVYPPTTATTTTTADTGASTL
ncbi:hypothetical protein LPMP_200840 [Leishmania panamensis]|uniref:Transcription factor Pcc1 n=1 Tax=Leishmania panamensis TaxID=5679 RepID=A0A088S7K9_LEIPA|nr:hypothetical protein LPMP_200840 [Leishmania panamensis]AIN97576.1 hypothetical protein LPMP_200840 [Leishmania panamensis]